VIKKVTFSLLLIAIFFEIGGRFFKYVYPLEVKKRYAEETYFNFKHRNNEVGAQGAVFKGQPIRVALFGSSIMEQKLVNSEEQWPSLIQKKYPFVHFDNFGTAWMNAKNIYEQIVSLKNRNIKYDIIIIQKTPYHEHHVGEWSHVGNWSRRFYYFPIGKFYFPSVVLQWLENRSRIEPFLKFFKDRMTSQIEAPKDEIYDLYLRQSEKEKGSLSSKHLPMTKNEAREIKQVIRQTVAVAQKLAPHVFWIPERIAYKDDMLPSVENKYICLRRTEYQKKEVVYMNAQAQARNYEVRLELLRDTLENGSVQFLDIFLEINKNLNQTDSLYRDEFHLTKDGNILFAQLIEPKLAELFSSEVRKNSKQSH
jgi:hypothetical protein